MVARFDFAKSEEVARWPIRELLISYLACLRERLYVKYLHDDLVWATTALQIAKRDRPKPPGLPELLKNPTDEHT
jgi:hypothetical protein